MNIKQMRCVLREDAIKYEPRFRAEAPELVAEFLKRQEFHLSPKEHFEVLFLNAKCEVFGCEEVSIGGINSTSVNPAEVFRAAILSGAYSIIVAHNHPGGSLDPSGADIKVTKKLCEAGELLGISLLDHIILAPSGDWLSMKTAGTVTFA